IGKLKNPKGVKHLIKNIKNDEKDIRLSVIEALGYMGSERAILVLKEAYKTSKSTNEKVLIIFSLSLSNKITSKHIEFLVNKAKKPSNKLITFVKDYLNKISLLNKEKFIKSVLSRTTKAQKTILKKFLDLLSKK
ncbi:MAG: HEAT repeat domain-containing protein, partial [Spirochaetota bacterium]|nr:HEAT repeat domain-containing protein [Spirochaetota bacterium]